MFWWIALAFVLGIFFIIGVATLYDWWELRKAESEAEADDTRFTRSVDNERWTCKTCRAIFYGTELKSYAFRHDCVANLRSRIEELTNGAGRLVERVGKLESWHPRNAFQSARLNTIEEELKKFNGTNANTRLATVEHGLDLHRRRIDELEKRFPTLRSRR